MSRQSRNAYSDNLVSKFNGRAIFYVGVQEAKSPTPQNNAGFFVANTPSTSAQNYQLLSPTNVAFGSRCNFEASLFSRFRLAKLRIRYYVDDASQTTIDNVPLDSAAAQFSALCVSDPALVLSTSGANALFPDDLTLMGGDILYGFDTHPRPQNVKTSITKSWLYTDNAVTTTEVAGERQSSAGQLFCVVTGIINVDDPDNYNVRGKFVLDYEFEFKGRVLNSDIAPTSSLVTQKLRITLPPVRKDKDESKEQYFELVEQTPLPTPRVIPSHPIPAKFKNK